MNMIPKVIHYCWFGGKPLPSLQQKCLKSWCEKCPDYEIRLWNEENFDIDACDYAREAYAAGKYAFVSDYARFRILQEFGGIFLDTDVELLRPLSDFPADGCFMACEEPGLVNTGLILGAPAGDPVIGEILEAYTKRHFLDENGRPDMTTVVVYVTEALEKRGLQKTDEIQHLPGVTVWPPRYFSPRSLKTGKVELTQDTWSIHHFAASWESAPSRFRGKVYRALRRVLGEGIAEKARALLGRK